jgi:hypothetical protein
MKEVTLFEKRCRKDECEKKIKSRSGEESKE